MKEQFGLCLILTDPVAGYAACARAAVDCGVRYLQLRMKNTPHAVMLKTALLKTLMLEATMLDITNSQPSAPGRQAANEAAPLVR